MIAILIPSYIDYTFKYKHPSTFCFPYVVGFLQLTLSPASQAIRSCYSYKVVHLNT